jgi:hypothetical protein
MEPVRVHLRVLGGSPLHGSDTLGFTDGDCPWNLYSRSRTAESFSQDDTSFRTVLFMLYIIC